MNLAETICEDGQPIAVHCHGSKREWVHHVSRERRPYGARPAGEHWKAQREDLGWWAGFITDAGDSSQAVFTRARLATCRLATPVGWRDFALGFEDLAHIRWAPPAESETALAAQHRLAYEVYAAVRGASPDEQTVGGVFAAFDVGDRGVLTRAELLAGLAGLGVSTSAAELDRVLEIFGVAAGDDEAGGRAAEGEGEGVGAGEEDGLISFETFWQIFVPGHANDDEWIRTEGKLVVPSPAGLGDDEGHSPDPEPAGAEAGAAGEEAAIPWSKFAERANRLAMNQNKGGYFMYEGDADLAPDRGTEWVYEDGGATRRAAPAPAPAPAPAEGAG